jgi:beta-glucosidase
MLSRIEPLRQFPGYLPGILLIALHCFIPGNALADEAILSNGAATEGNVMLIGDKKQWDTLVGAEPISSASGYLRIENDAEEMATKATWNGKGEAQFFIAHQNPADYSGHLDQESALVVLLRVEKKPKKKVQIRMGCGYPCASSADITKLLKALPPGEWIRLSFDLKCFAEGGLNVKTVDTPMLITTRGEMSLSISDVGIVPDVGPEATIRCRE